MAQKEIAKKTWEMSNDISEIEEIYKYDRQSQQAMQQAKPWEKDPHFFKDIKISALALLKMVIHARLDLLSNFGLHVIKGFPTF